MSNKSGTILELIKAGEVEPDHHWRGSLKDTWEDCVTRYECDTLPGKYFVYLWRFELFGVVMWKVGITGDTAKRFNQFCLTMPPLAKCNVAMIGHMETQEDARKCETRFLVACRDLHVGGEWLMGVSQVGAESKIGTEAYMEIDGP